MHQSTVSVTTKGKLRYLTELVARVVLLFNLDRQVHKKFPSFLSGTSNGSSVSYVGTGTLQEPACQSPSFRENITFAQIVLTESNKMRMKPRKFCQM